MTNFDFFTISFSGLLLAQSGWALVLLRIIFGGLFMAHGIPKLKNLKGTSAWIERIGLKPGMFWGSCIAVLEGVGGALLVLNMWVQWIALLFTAYLLARIVLKIVKKQRFIRGSELDVILFAVALILATMGGSAF